MDWEKYDKSIDLEGLQKDVAEAAENNQSFKEVPHGKYEVRIEKLELGTSKAGSPMLTTWFKILSGEYKGSLIFYNQVVIQPFQIHIAKEFLRSLDSGVEVDFKSYSQFATLVMDIHETIDNCLEYALDYSEGKKGFSNYKIVEVYEV